MKGFGVVFDKEFRESLRDRRSLISALVIGPLLGPVIFAMTLIAMLNMQAEQLEEPLQVPVVGAAHAPNLIQWLKQQGTRSEPAPAEPEQAVLAQKQPMVLVIPEDFSQHLQNATPAVVTVIQDRSRRHTGALAARLKAQLQHYGRTIGALRLRACGIDPSIAQAIFVRTKDLSTPQSRAAMVLGILPYFLMFALFIGGMYLAIDTTAGERERQSLEPLLLNPIQRGVIMLGKLAATVAMALISLVLSIIGFSVALRFVPLAEQGIGFALDINTCIWIFLVVAPAALFAGAVETIVAAFAKSFREAQTYVSFLLFIPLIPIFALMLFPVKAKLWLMVIPIVSQSLLIEQLIRGEQLNALFLVVSVATTLLAGTISAARAARLYHRERLAFSGG